jgi:membrane-associated phospholipid phosphatase
MANPQDVSAALVFQWNDLALEAIRNTSTNPLLASRALAIESLVVFDTINAIRGLPACLVTAPPPAGASLEAAISAAAHQALSYLFPAQQALFDAQLAADLALIPDGESEDLGVLFGMAIADQVIALRDVDGWNAVVPYQPTGEIGDWAPTPPGFAPALGPHWGRVEPFTLVSGDQVRPPPPPALTDAAYAQAFNEVKALGRVDSAVRTAEQSEIAFFWADGAGTETPPGHWNSIATRIAAELDLGAFEAARALALLNIGMADAAIACWDAKFVYDFWRPVTAIQLADLDGNPDTTADPDWLPLIATPPFPEYVSGHSTFSGVAAQVLTALFGEVPFVTTSDGLPNVQRAFDNFADAAAEAAQSRIYGGIHYAFASAEGLSMGGEIAGWLLEAFVGPASGSVYLLYEAVLGRIPDIPGRAVWADAFGQGFDLEHCAGLFLACPEFGQMHGDELSDADFVALIYQNALGRAADQAGADFWLDALQGGLSRAALVVEFVECAENQIQLLGILDDALLAA